MRYRRSLRWRALVGGHLGIDRALVAHGAHWRGRERRQILPELAQRARAEALRRVLAEPAPEVDMTAPRRDALMDAVQGQHAEAVRALVEADVAIDFTRPTRPVTPLHLAYERNALTLFRILLEAGADPNVRDEHGRSLLGQASHDHPKFALALLRGGAAAKPTAQDESPFATAITHDHRALAEAYLEHGVSPANPGRQSPLAAAAVSGWRDLLERMLDHRDVTPGSGVWCEAVNSAASINPGAARLFLEDAPARVPPPPDEYSDILCTPAAQGRRELIERLLERGIPVDGRDDDGDTALLRAAQFGRLDTVELLLRHGADVNAANDEGVSVLAVAVDAGEKENRALRAKYEDRPEVRSTTLGSTDPQAERHTFEPADTRDRPSHEPPPKPVTVPVREPLGVDVTMKQADVHIERHAVNIEVVRRLLEAGAAVDRADADGWTPLMRAAARGERGVVDALLKHGATRSATNHRGHTAADIAERHGHHDLAGRLAE